MLGTEKAELIHLAYHQEDAEETQREELKIPAVLSRVTSNETPLESNVSSSKTQISAVVRNHLQVYRGDLLIYRGKKFRITVVRPYNSLNRFQPDLYIEGES